MWEGKKKRDEKILSWGVIFLSQNLRLYPYKHMLEREVHDYLYRGPLIEPMGTEMTVLEKRKKWVRKKRNKMTMLGSPAPAAQSSWWLVMWSTSYTHQHMDLPTITKRAQNYKDGSPHSQVRPTTCHSEVRQWKVRNSSSSCLYTCILMSWEFPMFAILSYCS